MDILGIRRDQPPDHPLPQFLIAQKMAFFYHSEAEAEAKRAELQETANAGGVFTYTTFVIHQT